MPVTPRPKVRLRVLPSVLPLEIQLQASADAIQWRYIGQDWVDLVDIEDINASVTVGTVTTLAAGAPATVTNVGTAQDAVLNFGIPAGEDGTDGADGIVASVVAGTNVTIDNTDPANPIINAASGGGVSDGDHGDVVVSASGTVWTIDTGVVTTTKMGGDVTTAGKALLTAADAAAQRTAIGLGTTDNPQFNTVEVGSASDTTLSRSAPGRVAVEGVNVVLTSSTDTLTNKTLVDPAITGTVLEDIHTITDGAGFQIDPGNGSIQQVTLGADRTPAATNFANGEGILLMVNDGTARTITWTTVGVVWIGGSAPTLATTGWTHIVLYKVGGTIYGKHVGNSA
jgi:hypothetical protein